MATDEDTRAAAFKAKEERLRAKRIADNAALHGDGAKAKEVKDAWEAVRKWQYERTQS